MAVYCVSFLQLTTPAKKSLAWYISLSIGVASCVDNNNNIFVADQGYSQIQEFTSDGRFIVSIGEYGSGELQFDDLFETSFHPLIGRLCLQDTSNQPTPDLSQQLWHWRKGKWPIFSSYWCYCWLPWRCLCSWPPQQIFTPKGEFLQAIKSKGCKKSWKELFALVLTAVILYSYNHVSGSDDHHTANAQCEFITSVWVDLMITSMHTVNLSCLLAVKGVSFVLFLVYI